MLRIRTTPRTARTWAARLVPAARRAARRRRPTGPPAAPLRPTSSRTQRTGGSPRLAAGFRLVGCSVSGCRAALALADLEQVTVGIAKEGSDLPAIFDRLGEEAGASRDELGVRRAAIGDRDNQFGAGLIGIRWRSHRDRRLVRGRFAAGDDQEPCLDQPEDRRRAAVLADQVRAEDV